MENKPQKIDFCLPNSDGVEICLRDLVGKWIVLYFYPKDNTPGCTTEAVEFTQLLPEFEKLGAVVVGVSPDSPERHRKFIDKHNLEVLLLSDEEKEVMKKLGVWGKKKNYGREYEGVIRSTFLLNPKGEIVKEFRNVRAKGHAQRVLNELKKLVESETE
ncbi:MAG: peroxiredoxin [Epsilonproteobacteria bacterium]|nr:peroxiredoxin [Campylobacterota bacterium]NPA89512.1 peroxiredoxin [Campylobacterota bacterium]